VASGSGSIGGPFDHASENGDGTICQDLVLDLELAGLTDEHLGSRLQSYAPRTDIQLVP